MPTSISTSESVFMFMFVNMNMNLMKMNKDEDIHTDTDTVKDVHGSPVVVFGVNFLNIEALMLAGRRPIQIEH
jgi:hypothetical protein